MDLEANKITAPEQDQDPCRGYASLSEFIASDRALYIFRRFESLAVRNLLYLQDELYQIELQLKKLDDADVAAGAFFNLHTRQDDNEERNELIRKSAETLKVYGKFAGLQG